MSNNNKINSTVNTTDKYIHYLILSGIILLTLIIYSGSFQNGLTNWDDNATITNNKDIQNLSVPGIVKIFSSISSNVYQPLMVLTFSLVYNFFGLNPAAFHSVNVIFHLINIILVYIFVYELTGFQLPAHDNQPDKNKILPATFVSLFFAIHPMHTESVCWASGLDGPQYSIFYLASIIFYLKYLQNKTQDISIRTDQKSKPGTPNIKQRTTNYYLCSLFLFILSLLSKSMAVTLPVVLILLDYFSGRKLNIKTLIDKIPFFLLALVFGVITVIIQNSVSTVISNSMTHYSLFNRIFISSYSVAFYIISFVAPVKLSALHPSPEIMQGFLPLKYYLSPLLIIGLIFLILKIIKRKTNNENLTAKTVIFGTLFFLFTISVALIAGSVRHAEIAERYTYIPYIGLLLIAGHSILNLRFMIYNLKFIIVILFIFIFSILSYQRNQVWANTITLYDDVLEKYPRSYIAYGNRGSEKIGLQDFEGALKDYTKAIEINPKYANAFYNSGIAKGALGDKQGALQDFSKAIEIKPEFAEAYYNRGFIKYNLNDKQRAIQDFDKALELKPQNAGFYYNRGAIKYNTGDKQGALLDYNKAIELDPQNGVTLYNRGNAKYYLGDKDGACSDWRSAGEYGIAEAIEMIKRNCK